MAVQRRASCSSTRRSSSTARSTRSTTTARRSRPRRATARSAGGARWRAERLLARLQRRHALPREPRAGPGAGPRRQERHARAGSASLPGRTESSPVVVGNKVIVGCECGTLFAFDKKTGKTLWEADLPGEIKAAPAVSDGVAYVGDYSGTMSAPCAINDGIDQVAVRLAGRQLRPRRRLLRDRRGRLRPRLRRQQRRPRLQLREGDRRPGLEPDRGRRALRGGGRRRHARTPTDRLLRLLRRRAFYALDARTGDERWSSRRRRPGDRRREPDRRHRLRRQPPNAPTTTAVNAANGEKVLSFHDGAYNPVISDGKRLYLTGYKTHLRAEAGRRRSRRSSRAESRASSSLA